MKIVIAGGGTGGHLFPGIAIASEFLKQNKKSEVLFVNTGNKLERRVLSKLGFKIETINTEGIKGRGISQKIIAILKIPKAIFSSVFILKKFKPDVVIGMGSYSAGPVVLAAFFLRIKTAICEQNIFPGITNRFLSHIASKIYLSFEDTRLIKKSSKILVSGNPVRNEILNIEEKENNFTIFIIGGSQGAHNINIAMLEAAKDLDKKYFFIHQTGVQDEVFVCDGYKKLKHKFDARKFFNNMESQYAKADLIIARAGATTVAEIIATKKPTIFIPFPFASDNHQFFNAKSLEDVGVAKIMIEKNLSGKNLSKTIKGIIENKKTLEQMQNNFKKIENKNAAKIIVEDLINYKN